MEASGNAALAEEILFKMNTFFAVEEPVYNESYHNLSAYAIRVQLKITKIVVSQIQSLEEGIMAFNRHCNQTKIDMTSEKFISYLKTIRKEISQMSDHVESIFHTLDEIFNVCDETLKNNAISLITQLSEAVHNDASAYQCYNNIIGILAELAKFNINFVSPFGDQQELIADNVTALAQEHLIVINNITSNILFTLNSCTSITCLNRLVSKFR